MNDIEDKFHFLYHKTCLTTRSINDLKEKMNAEAFNSLLRDYDQYREFKLRDPNAILKILILSVIEELYLQYQDKSEFEMNIKPYFLLSHMKTCQVTCKYEETDKSLLEKLEELSREIYFKRNALKNASSSVLVESIYESLKNDERKAKLIALMARGTLHGFITSQGELLDPFLEDAQMKRKDLIEEVVNFNQSCNSNEFILNIICFCLKLRIRIIDCTTGNELNFPYLFKFDCKKTIVLVYEQDNSVYWILKSDIMFQNGYLSSHPRPINQDENKIDEENKLDDFSLDKKANKIIAENSAQGTEYNTSTYNIEEAELRSIRFQMRNQQYEPNETCPLCGFILFRCDIIKARYCEACRQFACDICKIYFNEKATCSCRRCIVCFTETCDDGTTICGKCKNICHECREANQNPDELIQKYSCGHSICNICRLRNSVVDKSDPAVCSICRE